MKRTAEFNKDGWLVKYDGKRVMRLDLLPWFNLTGNPPNPTRLCINLKGCNGSGKSTIPMLILTWATVGMYLVAAKGDKKPCGMYVPQLRLAIIGFYSEGVNCGGCDALGNTQVVKEILKKLWKRDVHIMYEGVIVGDIRSTFYEIMQAFSAVHYRDVSFCFMGTKLSECLRRIQRRNGGKPINEELVRQKYRNSLVQLKWYLEQGEVECKVLNTYGTPVEVFKKFMDLYPGLRA